MKQYISGALLTLAVFAAALLPGCADEPPRTAENMEFSAILVADYGDSSQEYKVYLSGKKVRIEILNPGSGVSIIRKDLDVLWTLMSDKKLFLELAIRPENKNPLVFEPDNILQYKKLGNEELDGRQVLKEKIVIRNEGDQEKEFYRWFDEELGWPVKAEAMDGKWKLRLKDMVAAPQDPSLFEIPAGFMTITARKRSVPH